MRLAYFCFIAAALYALAGMSLGIWMGINQDFSLAPAHAHLNLLGWATLALYGLYHRGVARPSNALAWTQAGSGALGAPLMTGGLAAYLGAGLHAEPFIIAGSLAVLLGMALFLVVVLGDLRRASRTDAASRGWPQAGLGAR